VKQWREKRNTKEEEEGVFIPTSPELSIGGILRPGRVTRHGWPVTRLPPVPFRVARPLVPVDPVGLERERLTTKGLFLVFQNIFLGFFHS
jgi:hypothetical protein